MLELDISTVRECLEMPLIQAYGTENDSLGKGNDSLEL